MGRGEGHRDVPTPVPAPVSLAELARRVPGSRLVGEDVMVSSVVHDSRRAVPGGLFVAVTGFRTDGHEHVADAAARGAVAALVEREVPVAIPQVVVPDSRHALATAAAIVYGEPSSRLRVAGVTGTNGKTTVTYLLESIVAAAGGRAAVVGTVETRIAGVPVPTERTTPEADDLQRILARAVAAGVDVAAVEVSSHALELHRVDAVHFAVGAFTNLGRDHLDFHGTPEAYLRAKMALFVPERLERAVVCVDDAPGRALRARSSVPTLTVATRDVAADVRAVDAVLGVDGVRFDLVGLGDRPLSVRLPLPGRFNVQNAAVAAGMAYVLGFGPGDIATGLRHCERIPGRLERVPGDRNVLVDYAHTPDAVAAAVAAMKEVTPGRLIVVVGAGGDRDRQKRPEMGRAAAAADVTIVTSDNPRSEDPAAIVAEVAAGARQVDGATVRVEVDRRAAITAAIEMAGGDDLVLILGKGHERGQEIAGRVLPFDDREVAREVLAGHAVGNSGRNRR